jgi:protein-tyrosine phosphatase
MADEVGFEREGKKEEDADKKKEAEKEVKQEKRKLYTDYNGSASTPGQSRSVRKRSLRLSVKTDLPSEEVPAVRSQRDLPLEDQDAFSFVCSKITEHIYISGSAPTTNLKTLQQHGIGYILNLTPCCPNCFPQNFVYKRVLLRDHAGEDISKCLFGCLAFIESAAQHNQRVLVHCTKGISRSSTVVVAYLMLKRNWGMQKALLFTKQCRPIVNPNCAFFFQLSDWEGSWPQAQFKNGAVLVYKVWPGKTVAEISDSCTVPRIDGPILDVSLQCTIHSYTTYSYTT